MNKPNECKSWNLLKKSVEYTVDSETLELIISNQDDDIVLSLSETYDEKIFLLQKRVEELEELYGNKAREALRDDG